MSDPSDLMTPAEAAAYYRVTRLTIYRWIKAGKLPFVKIGSRTVRVPRVAANPATTTPQPIGTTVQKETGQPDADARATAQRKAGRRKAARRSTVQKKARRRKR